MTYNGSVWIGSLRVDQEPSEYDTVLMETFEKIDIEENLLRLV